MQKQRHRSSGKKLDERWEQYNMFKREMGILRELDHPNIVKLYEIYEDKNYLYGVMEKLDGGELFPHIASVTNFSEGDAARICKQMLEAVQYIHSQGIVHRDIKGENFLFTNTRKDATLKMIDFGIADRFEENKILTEQCGTLHYLAPEMLKKTYNKEVDVWAVGVVMYLMLYGKFPFRGKDAEEIIQDINNYKTDWQRQEVQQSQTVTDFISRLLEKDPKIRASASTALRHRFITQLRDPKRSGRDRLISQATLAEAAKKEADAVFKGRHASMANTDINVEK